MSGAYRVQKYGWIPDLPDARDHRYAAPLAALGPLPPAVDLRPRCPGVYQQGDLGSCTGNAIAGAIQFDRAKQALRPDWVPSRLFIYYNERAIEHTIGTDAGAMLRDGIKSVGKQGVCPEEDWPYVTARFADKPSPKAYDDALETRAVRYFRVARSLTQMKGCLAEGYPFVFGFTVYESFQGDQVARTGVVPMPGSGEAMVGGHAVLAVGYDDAEQRFLVRNSWGSGWGQQGYFTMPYAYLTDGDLSDDFWTVRLVTGAAAAVA